MQHNNHLQLYALQMAAQVGIGATLKTVDGRIQIVRIKPEGGAAASGNIHVGDYLVAIDDVRLNSEAHAKELILGTSGTALVADVSRSGQSIRVILWRERHADAKADASPAGIKMLRSEYVSLVLRDAFVAVSSFFSDVVRVVMAKHYPRVDWFTSKILRVVDCDRREHLQSAGCDADWDM